MAAYFGSCDAPYAYTARSRLPPSTGASTETSPAEILPMEGLQDVPIHQYTGIRNLQQRVRSQSAKLLAGCSNLQYLIFRGVTKDRLAQIDSKRASIGKHTRMTHYMDTDLLIVKLMPLAKHETAHLTLADDLRSTFVRMGLPIHSLHPLGGTTFFGPTSSKEGDSAYKPLSREQETDWPIIVFESGLSERFTRLRHDAQWWLTNSGGDVKIAIIILITPAEKRLQVEKWCLSPATGYRPETRAYQNPNPLVPTRMQTITITQNPATPPNPTAQPGTTVQPSTIAHPRTTAQPSAIAPPSFTIQPGATASYAVIGAPLTLEFQNLLLRAPIPPEGDIVFTTADLSLWADRFWKCVK
ncbi:hypothetical protein K432DRAFT_430233 [Lepidopterella palustris CBS 459.81]|uniref:Uncharacterized protein n=1 Tax=Lepidopterella palustris CBS 459.81 TaxID=1314670 RepID=A0A8E2J997_9PEZI|nr:hypothetical protein K432DRAFT_430233 [Lepidopterella palustris CBS 459.81]